MLCSALLLPAARASAQGRPDCSQVLRALHNPKAVGHTGARTPNSEKVARLLGTDADYVEQCAKSFGRRIKRPKPADASRIDDEVDLSEKHEAEEYDEISREEKETEGDKYVGVIPDDLLNRKRLGANRDQDDTDVWNAPYEHHDWQPYLGHPWEPFEHEDDE